jgi:hypothetical protein
VDLDGSAKEESLRSQGQQPGEMEKEKKKKNFP